MKTHSQLRKRSPSDRSRQTARFLVLAGTLLLLLAALTNPTPLGWVAGDSELDAAALARASRSQLWLGATGALVWILAFAVRRLDLTAQRWVQRLTLAATSLALPLIAAELWLAPLVERGPSLYLRDPQLGWKHKPGAQDIWHGVPVRINAKGLRGPERDYDKAEGVQRVLFLGDSVTFGFRNSDDSKTLPAQVQRRLNEDGSTGIECINAGVDGYSPWQEQLFLEREGLRYQPDLVVFSFVLNDVTEKMSLKRFGGQGDGFQVEVGASDQAEGWVMRTNIARFASALGQRLQRADDAALRPGELSAYELLLHPDSAPVQRAWMLTLQSIERIVRTCREQHLPLLVVAFPYTVQIVKPKFNRPQRILAEFCELHQVPYLDLQVPIVRELASLGKTDEFFFMDAIHPTSAGYLFCAEQIVGRIRELTLLPR